MAPTNWDVLNYEGSNFFRQRVLLSVLSGRRIKIKNIRHKDDDPGIKDYEASFLQLIDKLTNGSRIEVNETGTTLKYYPGLLLGGKIEHECSLKRSITYYLEPLLCLAPFCKKSLDATLKGITNSNLDYSVDAIKYSALPILKQFLNIENGIKLSVINRGMSPNGGGEVNFCCPIRQLLRPVQLVNSGKVKRIRGISFAVRVSPTIANRMVEAAKQILLQFLPDVFISTDHYKGKHSGKSPGFGLTLVAETTNGIFFVGEAMSKPSSYNGEPSVPEDVAKEAVSLLLEEIHSGGCISSCIQSLACLFMALGQSDVSKVVVGPLLPYTIHFLRHMKEFLQVTFRLEPQKHQELKTGAQKIVMTCVGVGYTNLSRSIN